MSLGVTFTGRRGRTGVALHGARRPSSSKCTGHVAPLRIRLDERWVMRSAVLPFAVVIEESRSAIKTCVLVKAWWPASTPRSGLAEFSPIKNGAWRLWRGSR